MAVMPRRDEVLYWCRAIKETRKLTGLSINQLADRLGIERRTMRRYSSAERCPNGLQAVRIYEYRREQLFLAFEAGTVVPSQGIANVL